MSTHSSLIDNEFLGFSDSESSETLNDSRLSGDSSLKAVLEVVQRVLRDRDSRKQKVYIPILERFDGKTGDLIEG